MTPCWRCCWASFPAAGVPWSRAHDQRLVRDRFGVETTDRRSLAGVLAGLGRCDALVLGGGSLLQDCHQLPQPPLLRAP